MADFISYVVKQYSSSSSRSSVFLVDEDYKDEYILYYKTEAALEKAIRNNALEVYYQPIHEPGGKMVALEALCRIFDEELGALRPDMFITIAEQNGSIFKLTEQVLEKVCRFIVDNNINSWRLEHIGVNLSIMQFAQGRLSESIIKIINKYGIKPGILRFELTETESASSLESVRNNMNILIDKGFTFLLDDFGSGYANFNYLSELPFYCVKLDKSLLWNCDKERNSMSTLFACAKIVKQLGLLTVCEGVETKEQVDLLQGIGVNMLQGFYFSCALSEKRLIEYVSELEEAE